jgi:EmrB/QacA subfamily drug resistance transporter
MIAAKQTNNKLVITGVMLGLLFASLDQTIVSTALPTIVGDLGGLAFYSWVIAVYMLTESIGIPIFGKLSDLFDRKKIYLIGLGFFVVGSILCGLAQDIVFLIVARGIQGIGAGALMPLAFTMVADILPIEKRAKVQGLLGSTFMISSIIGPAIGGILTETFSWHWIFFINIPIAVLAASFIWMGYHETNEKQHPSIDWWGAVTLSLGIIAVLLTTILTGGEGGGEAAYSWKSPFVLTLLGIGLVLIGLFIWIETRAKEPILPLSLFKNKMVSILSIISFFMGLGMFGAISFLPLYLQNVQGLSATTSGYLLMPMMIGAMVSGILAGFILPKLSYRLLLMGSLSIMVIGFILFLTITAHSSLWNVSIYAGVLGIGMGILMPALNTLTQELVPKNQIGTATSSVNLFRSLGATIGISVLGAVLNTRVSNGLETLINQNIEFKPILSENIQQIITSKGVLPQGIYNQIVTLFVDGIHAVFLTSCGLLLVSLVVAFFAGKGKLSNKEHLESRN